MEDEFQKELQALLKKYNKEIRVDIRPVIVDGKTAHEVNVEVPKDNENN